MRLQSWGFAGLISAALSVVLSGTVFATPSQIIILRHGEKANGWKLCSVGEQRANALAANFLGKNAASSLFQAGDPPAAFLAITLHTLELASLAAATWQQPIVLFSVVPSAGVKKEQTTIELNHRTEEAVQDVLTNPAWNGKTVVMVWEHDHIADAKLEAKFPKEKVTLRQLLNLGALKDVPETWPGENYDYFWIVGYAAGSDTPTSFKMVKQDFPAPYNTVPANEWGKPNGLKPATGCEGATK